MLVALVVALIAAPPASAAPVPSSTVAQMKRQIAGRVYLPAKVPRGFHFVRWRLLARSNDPHPGDEWYSVTFKRRAQYVYWRVGVIQRYTCEARASDESLHLGGPVYYNEFDLRQDWWLCVRSGERSYIIDVVTEVPDRLLDAGWLIDMLQSYYRA